MDPILYSESLGAFDGEITNEALRSSLEQLAAVQPDGSIRLLKWSEDYIAVPVSVGVDLPPHGNSEGIDIRPVENLLFVFKLSGYPSTAPKVFPDRLDFPKNQLAHLYIAKGGRPPAFCMIRGGTSAYEEWYSNKRIRDLVTRSSNWLRDAAAGTLTEDALQFEPLRLEGYHGSVIYDYAVIDKVVTEKAAYNPGGNFAIGLFVQTQTDGPIAWRFVKMITPDTLHQAMGDIFTEGKKEKTDTSKKHLHIGYIIWSETDNSYSGYDVHLPETWRGLKDFSEKYGVNIGPLDKEFTVDDKNLYILVPILIAIRRPRPIIGYGGMHEIINFQVDTRPENVDGETLKDDTPVDFKAHRQMLTVGQARAISGFSLDTSLFSFVAGCGALGSRVVLHLAKSGTKFLILADPQLLSPHNFVRHPLSAGYVNMNKARALAAELQKTFSEDGIHVYPLAVDASDFLPNNPVTTGYQWIFDFTASPLFCNSLVNRPVFPGSRVCKAYISDFGDLGIQLFEGAGRNPRVDDLQALLYWKGMGDMTISEWLKREALAADNAVDFVIGIGCNTETTVLSDDIVALHAGVFSGIIKTEGAADQGQHGAIYLNGVKKEPYFQSQVKKLEFLPMSVMDSLNRSGWQVRVAAGILDDLRGQMEVAAPRETGGVLVGCANYKTKTVHIVGLIEAPPDSTANEVCFFRGKEGLPAAVDEVVEATGGQLGYIGEWHSHPRGPEGMSITDLKTVAKFRREFDELPSPLPVVLMIVTPKNILPFVYD